MSHNTEHARERDPARGTKAARVASGILGSYALIGGLLTLIGWFGGIPGLTAWDNTGTSMMPNAAVCAMGAGAALVLHVFEGPKILITLAGAFVGLVGGATLFEHLGRMNLGLDTLILHPEWGQVGTVAPGRMGLPASTSWTVIGMSLMLVSGGRRRRLAAGVGGAAVAAIAMLSLVGFLFGANLLYSVPRVTAIALQTATILLSVGAGIVTMLEDQQPMATLCANSTAGVLARRALPWIILLPLALGFLRVKGQEEGLFDTAFGTAIRTMVEFVFLLVLFWWTLAKVSAKEDALRQEQQRVSESLERSAFLAAASEKLAGLETVDEIMSSVGEMLGGYFKVSLCNFYEIHAAADAIVVIHEWRRNNGQSAGGVKQIASFQSAAIQKMCRAGELFVVHDTAFDSRAAVVDYAALGVRSAVSVPLKRDGEWNSLLNLHDAEPRDWSLEELHLIREMAGRIWTRVERARSVDGLRQANRAAEAANKAKDRFLAVLSHELRTPLNPVLLLASESAGNANLPFEVREDFATIAKNVTVEAQLIDDLLDLTKVTQGKLKLERRPIDAHVVLRDAIGLIKAEVGENRIELTTALQADQHIVSGDPVRLQQVFWNILKNAVKFTPPGGKIAIVSRCSEDNRLRIETTDSGIGLSPAELTSVFEAFTQGDHAQAGSPKQFGGLGLGLTISRMLTELHGGCLHANSGGRGLGSTFVVELPVLAGVAIPLNLPMASREGGNKPRGLCLLLVEDHTPTRNAVEALLTRRGHEVKAAGTVGEARELAMTHQFDLVVSDIGLPDGSGHDLMIELQRMYKLKGIALSGYGTESDIERGRNAGFIAHLTKPVNIAALDATLSAFIRV